MKLPKNMPPPKGTRPRIAVLADLPRNSLEGQSNGRGAGHAATWLPQLADTFANENDLEFIWLTLDTQCTEIECLQQSGQWFIRIPACKMTLDIITGHRISRTRLWQVISTIDPDLIHAWGTERSYPSVLKRTKVPSILSMQGILTEYLRIGALPLGWRWRWQAGFERSWVHAADIITTESEWGRQRILGFHPQADVRLVEYGVHPSFKQVKWDPDPERPIAFFCGTIDYRKGVDLLADAMTMNGNAGWECWMAGDGPLANDLRARAIPGLHLLGNLTWTQMREHLAKAWCLVLPTRADTSPNAVKEARVVGLPVVTSIHGGQTGYVIDNCNGFIVEPLEAGNLRSALDKLLSNFELTRKLGAARLEEDRDYLDPAHTAERFLSMYRQTLSNHRIKCRK